MQPSLATTIKRSRTMKKKIILISVGILVAAIAAGAVYTVSFFSNTLAAGDVEQYCIDNTTVGATSFRTQRFSSNRTYAFWVAENSDTNAQEIFVFRKAQSMLLEDFDRFSYIHSASSSINEVIGSIMFAPRDDNNRKTSTNMLLFYSLNKDRITHYTLTYYESGDECTRKGWVDTEMPFIISIPHLGAFNGVTKDFISAEFYDDTWNLIERKEF
jgi:hypothetical protein